MPIDLWATAEHPLLSLARQHHQLATQELIYGRFSPFKELSNPQRMLVVYRRRYGSGIVGDDYYVAQATYISEPNGNVLRPGETIALDFAGRPEVVVVEALLYRGLLDGDSRAQALIARHLASHD
jgi:hypothetical protein